MLGGEFTCLITLELANQRAQKALFTCVVYAKSVNNKIRETLEMKIYNKDTYGSYQYIISEWSTFLSAKIFYSMNKIVQNWTS